MIKSRQFGDMLGKRINVYPYLRDFLIIVNMVPLFLTVFGVAPHFLMVVSFLLLGACFGLAIYLLLMVKLWKLKMPGKIGAAIFAAGLIVAAFVFGLVRVFFRSLPEALSVTSWTEVFWPLLGLGIVAFFAMVFLTAAAQIFFCKFFEHETEG